MSISRNIHKITLNSHSSQITVLDGRDDLEAALRQSRENLIQAPYIAAIVVTEKSSLNETYNRSAATLDETMKNARIFASPGTDEYHIPAAGILSGHELSAQYGNHYKKFLDATCKAYPELVDFIIAFDQGYSQQPHIDIGSTWNKQQSLRERFNIARLQNDFLPGGVTMTLAVKGGGTVIAIPRPENLAWNAHGKNWQLISSSTDLWQVQNGDIAIMRMRDWPKDFLPCPHFSPAQAVGRIVGVGFINRPS